MIGQDLSISGNDRTAIDSYYSMYLAKYNSYYTQVQKLWNREDMYNKSSSHYSYLYYTLAFTYVLGIYLEYIQGIETDCNYYYDKHEITKYKDYFKCNGIYLEDLFTIFGMPFIDQTNVNGKIGSTFIVGNVIVPATVIPESDIDILNLTGTYINLVSAINYEKFPKYNLN